MAKKQRIKFIGVGLEIDITSDIKLNESYVDYLESEIARELENERLIRQTERNWDLSNPKGFSAIKKGLEESDRKNQSDALDFIRFLKESEKVKTNENGTPIYDSLAYGKAKQKIQSRTASFDDTRPVLMPKSYEIQNGIKVYFLDCLPV